MACHVDSLFCFLVPLSLCTKQSQVATEVMICQLDQPTLCRELYRNLLPAIAAFAGVTREGSYTRAAGRTGISPSGLSQSIRTLEQQPGVRGWALSCISTSRCANTWPPAPWSRDEGLVPAIRGFQHLRVVVGPDASQIARIRQFPRREKAAVGAVGRHHPTFPSSNSSPLDPAIGLYRSRLIADRFENMPSRRPWLNGNLGLSGTGSA